MADLFLSDILMKVINTNSFLMNDYSYATLLNKLKCNNLVIITNRDRNFMNSHE